MSDDSDLTQHIVDTHRHLVGPRLRDKLVAGGLYDPNEPLPQANEIDLFFYRDFVDLDHSMGVQRDGGVTKALVSNGGEVEALGERVLKADPLATVRFLNDERLEIRDRYPTDVEAMADAHALHESTRDVVDAMISRHGAKGISVCSSYGHGKEQAFLDAPEAEWLWEYAQDRRIPVHVHPPMVSIGHEALMQYRLIEAVGRPCDTAITIARMIFAGVFDKYPGLQVAFVHMGGGIAPMLGRLEFNWRLNYDGVVDPPVNKVAKNRRAPTDYFRSNIYVDAMGFSKVGLRAAIDMCGIDRVIFGTDYGPVPISPREHVDLVNDVVEAQADREKVLWRTTDKLFGLGLQG